jgi:ABC-type uncharacterized transport system permease subunit
VSPDLFLARLALAFYLAGVVVSFVSVLAGRSKLVRWLPGLALAGLVLNIVSFVRVWLVTGQVPLEGTPERISALAWVAVLIYLIAALLYRLEILGVIILPLAVILELVSNFLPTDVVLVPERVQPGLRLFHITVAILGVAALFLAFGASIVYLVQERGLKSKRSPRLPIKLPSLAGCDRSGHLALLWGFALLTVAIVTGAVWSANARAHYWLASGREDLALLAWIIIALILFARLVRGWRGRKVAYLTIVAFMAVLARMLGAFIPL